MIPRQLLAMVACLVFSASAFADLPPRTVSTSGEATVYVVPDEVVLFLGVETADKNLDVATQTNRDASAQLLKAIKALGIEEKHIQADDLRLEIRYTSSNYIIEAYRAQRQYSITLKDIKKFESVVDTALKNGANRLNGFEYRTSELRKHRDQARSMAIHAAKEKAAALAKELDCVLGKPRTIGEGSVGYFYSGWRGGNSYMMQNTAQYEPSGGGGGDSGDVTPLGQMAVRAQISVTFDLAD
jgi:uncharacterized protein YggE